MSNETDWMIRSEGEGWLALRQKGAASEGLFHYSLNKRLLTAPFGRELPPALPISLIGWCAVKVPARRAEGLGRGHFKSS
jgi:hypothetical protein